MILTHEAIEWLEGMARGNDTTLEYGKLAELLRGLVEAGQGVVDNADGAGCSDDLIVTSKFAIQDLSRILYPDIDPPGNESDD